MGNAEMTRRDFLKKISDGMVYAASLPYAGSLFGDAGRGKTGYGSSLEEKKLKKMKDVEIFEKIFSDFYLNSGAGQPMETKVDYLRDGTEETVHIRTGSGGSWIVEVPRHVIDNKVFEEFYITGFPEGMGRKITEFGMVRNPDKADVKEFLIDVYRSLEKGRGDAKK